MADKEPPQPQQAGRIKDAHGRPVILRVLSYPFRQAWGTILYVDSAWARGHPELELFPTVKDRRQALRRVMSKIIFRGPFWSAVAKTVALVILLGLLAIAVFAACQTPFRLPTRTELAWVIPPLLLLLVVVGTFFGNRWIRRYVPELLRHELLDCGVPICAACGYPLFSLRGPNCPECGRPFDEKVRRILDTDADSSMTE